MNEYIESYVAFLDILGFKNLLLKKEFNYVKQIFDMLMDFEPKPLLEGKEVYKQIHYYIMSDSIVVYIDAKLEDAFMALAEVCLQIQVKLANNNPPILIRGAIDKGPLYCEGNVIFGSGLSKAYILENTLAKYPRVIFTDATKKAGLQNVGKLYVFDYNHMFYKKDDDMLNYIDFLRTFDYIPSMDVKDGVGVTDFNNNYFENLYNYVEKKLASEINCSVREKFLWLQNKILNRIEEMPDVKKHFDEIKSIHQEEDNKRFEMALTGGANQRMA